MKTMGPAAACVAALIGYGVAEALWTDRWRTSGELERAAARLAAVPAAVGEWQGQDEGLDPRQVQRAEMAGHVLRRYTHRGSRAGVTVLVVCGRPGPTSVHSPDVCFKGAGYSLAQPPARRPAPGGADEFWVGDFRKGGPSPEPLRIWWGWAGDGPWQAADNPRLQFAGRQALYKLYVIRGTLGTVESSHDDIGQQFLRDFLPALQTALAGPA